MDAFILHGSTIDEFRKLISDVFDEKITSLLQEKHEEAERLLTRKEVCEMLSISLPTLNNWTKEGIIPAQRIGGSVRYKNSDIRNAMENIHTIKHSRYNNR